ncbi:MAG: UvrD-helicase domain-containing protein [Bacteroidota bacterium]
MENFKITIAGPGTGKTHDLKDQVLSCLSDLENHKFCVVITYTNAATEELRNRIFKEIKITPNIFIGTIHSFLIRFFIEPYGHILRLTILDKFYVDNINVVNSQERNAIQNKLSQTGIITYDKIIILANEIIRKDGISRSISNRIQYLFVDEYQDTSNNTNKIINKLKRTNIFIIGDPLQYIYAFRRKTKKITNKQITTNKFDNTPLQQLRKKYPVNILNVNYRSSGEIIKLINNFILDNQYKQSEKPTNDIPIYFIENFDDAEILSTYSKICDRNKLEEIHSTNKSGKRIFKNLILTSEWPKSDSRLKKLQILYKTLISNSFIKFEKGNYKLTSHLQEISRCIQGYICEKKNVLLDNSIHEELRFRAFCFYVIRKLKEKKLTQPKKQVECIKDVLRRAFPYSHDLRDNSIQFEIPLQELLSPSYSSRVDTGILYSSIHSSKGLEATSVLVIAYSQNELKKWLDFEKANSEMDDDYRLGYVAFSRARDMLCIACLEKIDEELKQKLKALDILCLPNT